MLSAVSFLAFLGGVSREWIVVRLAEGQSWLTAVCFFAFLAAFAAAVFYAVLGELNRKHTVAFAVFAIAMTIAAQKNMTNGTDGVSSPLPPMLQMIPPAGPMASGGAASGSATNEAGPASLEITSFFITTNGAGFAMCWPSGLDFAYLELLYSERLVPNAYTLLDRWTVDAAQTNDTRFVAFGGSFTNAASGFFTAFGHTCGGDPDGDGLSTGMEHFIGTDPFAADTDGDGSSDGEELGVATVLTGGDFLWFDISASVNRIRWDQDSYWWIDNPDERLRFGGERLGHVESSVDGFTHLYVSEIPNVWSYGWCEDGVSFRTDSLSGGYLTVAAANADLYARPDAWGSAFRYASVVTNGTTCYVLQCSNLGLKDNRTGDSPLLSYEVIFPENEPDVAYVSYGRVDAGIRSLDMELGVQVAAWRNPLATNEYYTLMCPVACSNLCAGTTIRYRLGAATDPLVFDTDGDGAPDGADPFPLDRALGSYGQDETWVRMNFTNAEEILSVGYANWVDAQVGVGLTNGLYKFTATFVEDPSECVKLTVGDFVVAVTNAGEYVFLLGKGHHYAFGTNPYIETVGYSSIDDLSPPCRVLRAAGSWSESGVWSVAGGEVSFSSQTQAFMGEMLWQPMFRGYPNVVHIGPNDSPVSFSAVLTDLAPDIEAECFYWAISGPLALSSQNGIDVDLLSSDIPSWSEINLSVTACLPGDVLTSSLVFTYGTNTTPQVNIGLSLPSALLLREDWVEDSRSATARVTFSSDVETNGVIRVSLTRGADKVAVRQYGLGDHTFGNAREHEIAFPVDGTAVSSAVGDVTLLCEYIDAGGVVACSASGSLTVVSPKRVCVNNDAVQDVAVIVGSTISATIIAEPSSTVVPITWWYDAKLRSDRSYTGWRQWGQVGESVARTMSESGIFIVKARVVFPGPQWADVFYAWTEDEDFRIGSHCAGDANHIGVASTQEQLNLRFAARAMLGSAAYARRVSLPARNGFSPVDIGKWKCNSFVADMAITAGLTVPIQHTTGIIAVNTYPPVANEWAHGNVQILGWNYLGSAVWPEPGLIVAHPSSEGSGHVGVVDYDGEGIAAGERTVNRRYGDFLDGSCGYNIYERGN